MNQLTVQDPLKTQLEGLSLPVELVDGTGRKLGLFLPVAGRTLSDDCPYSAEELRRMQDEQGGHPLSEIWNSLGAVTARD
jgi:hypothetical protein